MVAALVAVLDLILPSIVCLLRRCPSLVVTDPFFPELYGVYGSVSDRLVWPLTISVPLVVV